MAAPPQRQRRIMFVKEALVAGEGLTDVNLMLIEVRDGVYTVAKGAELGVLMEEFPNFLKAANREW